MGHKPRSHAASMCLSHGASLSPSKAPICPRGSTRPKQSSQADEGCLQWPPQCYYINPSTRSLHKLTLSSPSLLSPLLHKAFLPKVSCLESRHLGPCSEVHIKRISVTFLLRCLGVLEVSHWNPKTLSPIQCMYIVGRIIVFLN